MQNTGLAVECRDLSLSYGDKVALNRIQFSVPVGAVFGLLGPNGSGKTTTIRILCGVLKPTSGTARVFGVNVAEHAETLKPSMGYMSQSCGMYLDLTVRENLVFFGRLYGLQGTELQRAVGEAIANLGLQSYADRLAGHLSGGWKQRLAFGCAIIHRPRLVFLDEPTAGIDPVARRELWEMIYELSHQGVTAIVTTHYMDEAERCTHLAYLHRSRMLVCGSRDRLAEEGSRLLGESRLYRLAGPTAIDTRGTVKCMPGVVRVSVFGRTLHVLAQPSIDSEALRRTVPSVEVSQISPSLEDVFVHLADTSDAAPNEAISARGSYDGQTDEKELGPQTKTTLAISQPTGETKTDVTFSDDRRTDWWNGFRAVLSKETSQLGRQPSTLFFVLFLPLLQTLLFGYAIQLNVRNIPFDVLDLDQSETSRRVVSALVNSGRFALHASASQAEELETSLRRGDAAAAFIIPSEFSTNLASGRSAAVQVLVDGSDYQTATAAQNAAKLISIDLANKLPGISAGGSASQLSSAHADLAGTQVDFRIRILFNEGLESARFFVPGLVGIILQLVTLALTTFSIVRERENGTLEQTFVTPVGKSALLLGKIVPYAAIGFVEALIVATLMVFGFGVAIAGDLLLLSFVTIIFIVCTLSLGILISTFAKTQLSAMQLAYAITLPSVLLSGFMYPRAQMPTEVQYLANALPATHYIEMVRAIVLKSASGPELREPMSWLLGCTSLILGISLFRFRKQLG